MCIRDRRTRGQFQNGISLQQDRAGAQRSGIADNEFAAIAKNGIPGIGIGIVPVSYTHLDVYKRQD